jgi:2-polyprenyl-3-methyl-5-hydroxy-6-metoxy-1,4-benzoquinol methylase
MKEEDIRPAVLLQRYRELSKSDANRYFGSETRLNLSCVACGANEAQKTFIKSGFQYEKCKRCGTLYQTPRPPLAAFESFYRNSASSNYWAEVFFPAVAEARRDKIFRPRAKKIAELAGLNGLSLGRVIDVGAGYGIFLDELKKQIPGCELIAIEPSTSLAAECRAKGLQVAETIVEKVDNTYEGYADLVVCFEVLEHAHDPLEFVHHLKRLARPGGMVFLSTLCIDGFDLQVLWDRSEQISPPHHINFFSVLGFQELFRRAGLEDTEVITPGQLDVDIVRNASAADPTIFAEQRFLRHILSNDRLANEFQKFLVNNQLSSHAWVMGKVPTDED